MYTPWIASIGEGSVLGLPKKLSIRCTEVVRQVGIPRAMSIRCWTCSGRRGSTKLVVSLQVGEVGYAVLTGLAMHISVLAEEDAVAANTWASAVSVTIRQAGSAWTGCYFTGHHCWVTCPFLGKYR